jgi:hypothetical protein
MKQGNTKWHVWIMILLCIITRIPQLISPHLILDGDECVVAVMAKHIMHGKGFPLYFYGQAYGLSIIEVLFIIPFYWVLGMSTLAVKLSMLTLWITGVVFFYKALVQIDKTRSTLALLITLLLVCSPAWAVWSMKARGGYLTAFTLTSIVLYLMFHERHGKRLGTYIICGLLVPIIYEAQMLWIPSLLLLVTYPLIKNFSLARLLSFLLPCVMLFIGLQLYKQQLSHFFEPVYTFPTCHTANYFIRIPEYIFQSIQGNYYFTEIGTLYFFNAVFAALFTAFILAMPLFGLYYIIKKRKNKTLLILSLFSLLPVLFATIFDFRMEPRFLLPVSGFALLALFLLVKALSFSNYKLPYVAYTIVVLTGLISTITFYNYSFLPYDAKAIAGLIQQLKGRGVHHVFCSESLLSWQINFYSQEEVIARDDKMPGRYPPYLNGVNEAFAAGKATAIVSPTYHFYGLEIPNTENIDGFLVGFGPPKAELAKRFDF